MASLRLAIRPNSRLKTLTAARITHGLPHVTSRLMLILAKLYPISDAPCSGDALSSPLHLSTPPPFPTNDITGEVVKPSRSFFGSGEEAAVCGLLLHF